MTWISCKVHSSHGSLGSVTSTLWSPGVRLPLYSTGSISSASTNDPSPLEYMPAVSLDCPGKSPVPSPSPSKSSPVGSKLITYQPGCEIPSLHFTVIVDPASNSVGVLRSTPPHGFTFCSSPVERGAGSVRLM